MKSSILYFLLLIFKIPLNLSLDISYKQDEFFKILLEKNLEFVSSRRNNIVSFNLGLVLLLIKVDLIIEK